MGKEKINESKKVIKRPIKVIKSVKEKGGSSSKLSNTRFVECLIKKEILHQKVEDVFGDHISEEETEAIGGAVLALVRMSKSKDTDHVPTKALTLKLANTQVQFRNTSLVIRQSNQVRPMGTYNAVECSKTFNVTVSRVKKSITALRHKRYDRVTSWMTSAITDTTDCEEVSQEFGSVVHDQSELLLRRFAIWSCLLCFFFLKGKKA
ncbi:hypothetical protein ACFE04_030717 [Oxalis oulophora]